MAGCSSATNSAVINGAVGAIGSHFHAQPAALGLAVSSASGGAAIGALLIGRVADNDGRLLPMRLAALLFVVSAIGAGLASSLLALSIFRIVGGVAAGIASVFGPAYIAEVAPAKIRGRLGSLQQLAIASGIFASLLVDYGVSSAAGGSTAPWFFGLAAWRWMFEAMIVPAAVCGALSLTIPGSPRFLVAKGRIDDARAVLTRVLGSRGLTQKIDRIRESLGSVETATWRDLRGPVMGRPLARCRGAAPPGASTPTYQEDNARIRDVFLV